MRYQNTSYATTKKGFTLIEVLVSLSIFTIVVTISVSALMTLIDVNSRAQNIQNIMTNLSFTLDSMTREIRTGSYYYCGDSDTIPVIGVQTADCPSGSTGFGFVEGGTSLTGGASSRWIAFRLNNGVIERRLGNGDGTGGINDSTDWIPVTAPNITITELMFYTTGSTRRDSMTPAVTIYIAGEAGSEVDTKGSFDIQTTVSQQLIDI